MTSGPAPVRDLTRLPKAHLHVHLESAVREATATDLAHWYGRPLPAPASTFAGFAAFAANNALIRDCLRDPADFHRIAVEFCADEAAQGTRYAEVTFTAASHGERLGTAEAPLEAVLAGLAEGGRAYGIACRVILDHPRRRPVARAEQTLRLARRYAADGVVAIGLAGHEGHPVAPFAGVCAAARDAGVRLVHHAGETCGPASIREALEVGLADRIGHGIRALDDPGLVAELRDRGIALEVCPSSNVALGLAASWAAHPLPRLAAAGLRVTLNTDVPASVGTTLTREYALARDTFGYDDESLAALARTAVDASFAPAALADRLRHEITEWLDTPSAAIPMERP